MSSASKKSFLFILFFLQTSTASSSKLLGKDMLQFVGNFLEPDSAHKMKQASKKWSKVKIYENIFSNTCEVAVFKNVNTEEIIWEGIKFTELWRTIPEQKELVLHLRRSDGAKWNDVFLWFAENRIKLMKNRAQNDAFFKKLMLAIVENVDPKFEHPWNGNCPLGIAAVIDDIDSILKLIKRGADVNQRSINGSTALHYASAYGNMNACAALLENNGNIDAANVSGWTPLMVAAIDGRKDVFDLLIEKGADKDLTDHDGGTALQYTDFKER